MGHDRGIADDQPRAHILDQIAADPLAHEHAAAAQGALLGGRVASIPFSVRYYRKLEKEHADDVA